MVGVDVFGERFDIGFCAGACGDKGYGGEKDGAEEDGGMEFHDDAYKGDGLPAAVVLEIKNRNARVPVW